MVNLPVPLTSFVPTEVRLSNAALQSLGFRPMAVAMAIHNAGLRHGSCAL